MSSASRTNAERNRSEIAFGPEMPGWGSWEWVGSDIAQEIGSRWRRPVMSYRPWDVPEADVVVIVKHRPPIEWLDCVRLRSAVIYAPVDYYGAVAEIDADSAILKKCNRIIIHCERLRRYFATYAPVEYLDHHVKFATAQQDHFQNSGGVSWVGVRSNLKPLVDWVNAHGLPKPIDVMSNFEDPECLPSPQSVGFRPEVLVRLHLWSRESQSALMSSSRVAIDVKGQDFRSRHKPPAKALDFLAAGVPLAMNQDSSPVEHLSRLGFEIVSPINEDRWLSRDYWEETRRFGQAMKEILSIERVARRWLRIIDEVK